MNIAYKGEKLCYYDVATGKYLDPETLEEARETKATVAKETVAEMTETPVADEKSTKKNK